ncbi:NADP-dependent malic enzyme, mitochondrial [Cichlidogyrus casuarinus]|uniref:Malic enzyme n=1 Tax=Cichlidogyrus casuarinus TaxID=1844966 RepID=A0ABD2QAU4_9PLAT
MSTKLHGIDVLREPHINKGTAFTIEERQLLGIHGLLPPGVFKMETQVKRTMAALRDMNDNLQRFTYLNSLQDRNEILFYKTIIENVEYCMPLIYTPTVGLACQRYGVIFRKPHGLYITIHDRDHIDDILDNWPEHTVKAIVVTDGERILGLGDLGASGMGIPIGKLSLYSALAGVHPKECLPILLDVGTNNPDLLADPVYMGVRHKRITDERYDDFIDKFIKAIVKKYGMNCLVQWEDFANQNAFRILEKYKDLYCTFNDDIQGTASVAVAGLLAAGRITERPLKDNVFLFVGAGEAATGIAHLLHKSLQMAGDSKEEAFRKIYMFDKDGLLVKNRPEGNLTDHNGQFAHDDIEPMKDLYEIVKKVQPTAIIGASGVGGLFTRNVLKQMAINSPRPIVFALSNPTSKAECTAEQAYTTTEGRCVFTSGSPFEKVKIGEKVFEPGQCNNAYIFPGLGLAITAFQIRPVPEECFVIAAETLASHVEEADLAVGRVFPPLGEIREVSQAIALKIGEYAYEHNLAHFLPKPDNMDKYLKEQMFNPTYPDIIPTSYDWPSGINGPAHE